MTIDSDGAPSSGAAARGPAAAAARADFWRKVPAFSDLSASVAAELSAISRRQHWPAGAMLFQRDDPSTQMFAVERGRVRLSLQTSSGREFALRHVGPGTLFGEIGILDDSARSADATAVAATWAYVVERRQFQSLMDRRPELARATIRHLCSLLRYTTEHIETIALYGLEGRIARFILSQLPSDEGDVPGRRPVLNLELNQSDIAELLGASRPKINRAIAALEKAGAIKRDGKAMICDPRKLNLLADPEVD